MAVCSTQVSAYTQVHCMCDRPVASHVERGVLFLKRGVWPTYTHINSRT